MGLKPLPLFKEIYETYIKNNKTKKHKTPSTKECRKKLFPSKNWINKFPQIAKAHLSQSAIKKDMKRTIEKMNHFGNYSA